MKDENQVLGRKYAKSEGVKSIILYRRTEE